jgi:hypothetical protein
MVSAYNAGLSDGTLPVGARNRGTRRSWAGKASGGAPSRADVQREGAPNTTREDRAGRCGRSIVAFLWAYSPGARILGLRTSVLAGLIAVVILGAPPLGGPSAGLAGPLATTGGSVWTDTSNNFYAGYTADGWLSIQPGGGVHRFLGLPRLQLRLHGHGHGDRS